MIILGGILFAAVVIINAEYQRKKHGGLRR